MNTTQKSTIVALMAISTTFAGCEKSTILASDNIPSEITSYTKTHFPNSTIVQITKERDDLQKSYEVILDGSVILDFNRKKEITEIDGLNELPTSVIPEKIRNYVLANYSNNVITDWELDDKNQAVGLNDGTKLVFNMSDDFLRIDN